MTTKAPKALTIDERIALIKREICMCAGSGDTDPNAKLTIAALLLIIARQERDEALYLGETLFRLGQARGTNDAI